MRKKQAQQRALEERLRSCAPALRAPDGARVDRACARAASAAPLSPLRTPHTFVRPMLRLAACLALMLVVAQLMRPKPRPAVPALPSFTTLSDIKDLMVPQNLKNSLACEAEDLASDLADLTAVLNERTFAILF
jgi:hypothetical protein